MAIRGKDTLKSQSNLFPISHCGCIIVFKVGLDQQNRMYGISFTFCKKGEEAQKCPTPQLDILLFYFFNCMLNLSVHNYSQYSLLERFWVSLAFSTCRDKKSRPQTTGQLMQSRRFPLPQKRERRGGEEGGLFRSEPKAATAANNGPGQASGARRGGVVSAALKGDQKQLELNRGEAVTLPRRPPLDSCVHCGRRNASEGRDSIHCVCVCTA